MNKLTFNKELYSKTSLIKAAYNFTDLYYVHLDADEKYYYVSIEAKSGDNCVSEKDFVNEMLAQSVRHEVYLQTKNIRELLLARAMATSIIVDDGIEENDLSEQTFLENEILKDWFDNDEKDADK